MNRELMESADSQLIRKLRDGDHTAAVRLIELHYENIYNFLYRLAGSSESDAADLTQQTFATVWKRLPTFEARHSLSAWLHRIAYYLYVDWRRSHRRQDERSPEWWDDQPDSQPGADEIVAAADMKTALFAQVEDLDPDLRAVVHCHYFQELTLQETADALEIATSTVKYRLRQALSLLEAKLARAGEAPRPAPPRKPHETVPNRNSRPVT